MFSNICKIGLLEYLAEFNVGFLSEQGALQTLLDKVKITSVFSKIMDFS